MGDSESPIKRARRRGKNSINVVQLSGNHFQPHGDEMSSTQAKTQTQHFEEASEMMDADSSTVEPVRIFNASSNQSPKLQSERLIFAIKRAHEDENIWNTVEDLDAFEPINLDELLCIDEANSPLSVIVIPRTPTVTGEFNSQKIGLKLQGNICSRIADLSKSFDNSQNVESCSPSLFNFAFLRDLSESMNCSAVITPNGARNFASKSHLVISASPPRRPLPKMVLEPTPKQASVSIISGCNSGLEGTVQEEVSCGDLCSIKSLRYRKMRLHDGDLSEEGVAKDDTEISLLGSGSIMLESNIAKDLASVSCSSTGSSTSADSSEVSFALETTMAHVSTVGNNCQDRIEMHVVSSRNSGRQTCIEIRRRSFQWVQMICLLFCGVLVLKGSYTNLLLGDWLTIGGIISALCTIVLISFVRQMNTS